MYDHIDLRVTNFNAVRSFYDALLPALGFGHVHGGAADDKWIVYQRDGDADRVPFFAVVEEPQQRPDACRIAFAADSRAHVDRVADIVRQNGGKNIEGPELCEEYSPAYYAVFFEDLDGNRFEVCCRH